MVSRSTLVLFVAFVCACNTSPPSTEAPPAPSATPTQPAATPRSAVHLGDAITAPDVLLSDIAKDPGSFAGRSFTTRGTVSAVCQEMGCWMEIKDGSSGAHLRMHGHSFFVPKTASGRTARVQAMIVPAGAPKACAGEAECAGKDLALLQLDATGVELD